MTNAAVTVNESYQSVRCLTADSYQLHGWTQPMSISAVDYSEVLR